MKRYIQNYMEHYGYGVGDTIVSEVSGLPCSDIHHIRSRGRAGSDDVSNLIALTREEHNDAHTYKYTQEELQEIHDNFSREC